VKRSSDRILTTHVGSLARTPAILEGMKARTLNRPYDQDKLADDVREGIREVVRKQAEVGIDVPSHGELGRPGFRGYVSERLGGLDLREPTEDEASDPFRDLSVAERPFFPGFFEQYYGHYRYLWMPPEVDISEVPNRPGTYEHCRVIGPITYTGQAVIQREIDTLKAAMQGLNFADAFIPADLPTTRMADETSTRPSRSTSSWPARESGCPCRHSARGVRRSGRPGAGPRWSRWRPSTACPG
jgi:5-methyltetrahydropteroyltriglutamate--homocysteine methyltransferase